MFRRCAAIAAHYHLSDVFDNLIISLCKLSSLLTEGVGKLFLVLFNATYFQGSGGLAHMISSSIKLQQCAHTLFLLCHHHGNVLREGWNNILDCIINLFSAHLLPDLAVVSFNFANLQTNCFS